MKPSLVHVAWPLLAVTLAGCAGAKGPPTQFYVLSPLNAPTTSGTQRAALVVDVAAVDLPEYLDRPQIVTRTGTNRLEMADDHQWGGNLRKDMARILAENISRLLGGEVTAGTQPAPLARVEMEVMRFERMPEGRVTLAANWSISLGRDRRRVAARFTELESDPVPADDYTGIAAAMSDLLGRLSQTLADEVRAQAKGHSSTQPSAR